MQTEKSRKESLENQVELIVEEGRMVLPGIQALFGFQLIAVFNASFSDELPRAARILHLLATVMVACAIALIMAPAAYHRQAERDRISHYFADYASTMITVAMLPLLIALAIEVALISYVIVHSVMTAWILGGTLALLYSLLWFVYPRWRRSRRQ